MYNYEESIAILIERFPSLKSAYEEDVDYYQGLPYVFYEDVFLKYIMDKVETYNEPKLSNIFDFIEDMLENGDDKTKNLVEVAVVENLYYDSQFAWKDKSLLRFYGRLTKKSFQECTQ